MRTFLGWTPIPRGPLDPGYLLHVRTLPNDMIEWVLIDQDIPVEVARGIEVTDREVTIAVAQAKAAYQESLMRAVGLGRDTSYDPEADS